MKDNGSMVSKVEEESISKPVLEHIIVESGKKAREMGMVFSNFRI